ncbi:DUF962-domain-containing protein [Irpex lacteus]|nr:DUF962-domain-containing protein [Irpex lacteus]
MSTINANTGLTDVKKQFTFYGAYHNHPVNIAIHTVCVPLLLWSFAVMATNLPLPESFPHIYHEFNDYFIFELNFPVLLIASWATYYFFLEPFAALLWIPTAVTIVLTSRAFAERSNALVEAAVVHAVCWIAQFIGHGVAEKRAPALLDNVVGALVLAQFFVHLEVLFKLGYRPKLHHEIKNSIGVEIARIRKIEGDKRRAAEAKSD